MPFVPRLFGLFCLKLHFLYSNFRSELAVLNCKYYPWSNVIFIVIFEASTQTLFKRSLALEQLVKFIAFQIVIICTIYSRVSATWPLSCLLAFCTENRFVRLEYERPVWLFKERCKSNPYRK